jgi:ABC-type glycerol-3-phosphate transport system substrate-binding protein
MIARRLFAAAAIVLGTAACGGGSGPTLADNSTSGFVEPPRVSPEVPPTDTTAFVPQDEVAMP